MEEILKYDTQRLKLEKKVIEAELENERRTNYAIYPLERMERLNETLQKIKLELFNRGEISKQELFGLKDIE